MVISVEEAIEFPWVKRDRLKEAEEKFAERMKLSDEDKAAFLYTEGMIDSAICGLFDGGSFSVKLSADKIPLSVVAAILRAGEAAHWYVEARTEYDKDRLVNRELIFTPRTNTASLAVRTLRSRTVAGQKPRVILVSDVRGWAFDQNMHDLAEYLEDDFEFSHFYVCDWFEKGERPRWDEYDLVFECFHRNPYLGLPKDRTIGALRSQFFNPEKKAPPTKEDIAQVNSYAAFQFAAKRNFDEVAGDCPHAVYLTNPINMRRFEGELEVKNEIIASWNGNAKHSSEGRFIKHFYDIIEPACKAADVKLVAAEYDTFDGPYRRRTLFEMPEFYRQANVALCASEYEAASNSTMESMASGLALLATDVGNHREMRDAQIAAYGDTGIVLVERSVEAFVDALRALTPKRAAEMGKINRQSIKDRWSWEIWAPKYREVFAEVLARVGWNKLEKKLAEKPEEKMEKPEEKMEKPEEKMEKPEEKETITTVSPTKVLKSEVVRPPTIRPNSAQTAPLTRVTISARQTAEIPKFDYWNEQDPEEFLCYDRDNPSRAWVGEAVKKAVSTGARSMVEVGPATGTDYEYHLKKIDGLLYKGFEGSLKFCEHLKKKFPEVSWVNATFVDLPIKGFDIVYTKAVFEHQPQLEPHLSCFLEAARQMAIIVWYRPPAVKKESSTKDGVYYHTFVKSEVLGVIESAGWRVVSETPFQNGNSGWILERDHAS